MPGHAGVPRAPVRHRNAHLPFRDTPIPDQIVLFWALLGRPAACDQPEPGVQDEIFERKISRVEHRLAPGENLADYAERLTQKLHGVCIISRLSLTCDVGSGTYPYQGPVEKMSEVELLIAWLHV